MKKPLIIIAGPTAAGKTEISIKLAKAIGGEIISADSMQVYKGFDIGTAKITPEEMQGVKHFLIDELEPTDDFSVFEFKKRACAYIDEIISRGHIPVLVGGTGFYIQSVLYDIEFTDEETDRAYRDFLERLAQEKGASYLHEMLLKTDPDAAAQIHENNIKRTIRALEYAHETGGRISAHNAEQRAREPAYNAAFFVLTRERALLYDRIEKRVDKMLSDGLVEEVSGLLSSGLSPELLSMQGLGYKEIVSYINGELTLSEAVDLLKKSTRHFAKRQITWFKREPDAIWLDYGNYRDTNGMLTEMLSIIKGKNIYSGSST